MFDHLCRIQVRFTEPLDTVMDRAAELGRDAGLDHDWYPTSIEAAVFEILISSNGAPEAHGVIPVSASEEPAAPGLFEISVRTRIEENPRAFVTLAKHLLIKGWPETVNAVAAAILMQDRAYLDFGLELDDVIRPVTAHDRVASLVRARAAVVESTARESG